MPSCSFALPIVTSGRQQDGIHLMIDCSQPRVYRSCSISIPRNSLTLLFAENPVTPLNPLSLTSQTRHPRGGVFWNTCDLKLSLTLNFPGGGPLFQFSRIRSQIPSSSLCCVATKRIPAKGENRLRIRPSFGSTPSSSSTCFETDIVRSRSLS